MTQINIKITDDTKRRWKAAAAARGVSLTEFIAGAVEPAALAALDDWRRLEAERRLQDAERQRQADELARRILAGDMSDFI